MGQISNPIRRHLGNFDGCVFIQYWAFVSVPCLYISYNINNSRDVVSSFVMSQAACNDFDKAMTVNTGGELVLPKLSVMEETCCLQNFTNLFCLITHHIL